MQSRDPTLRVEPEEVLYLEPESKDANEGKVFTHAPIDGWTNEEIKTEVQKFGNKDVHAPLQYPRDG